MIGLGLGNACGDRTDADFRNQFDADRSLRIGVLEVVNELRQVLDRVDIVVRRWRYEADTGYRVAQETNVLRNLVARQLSPFAGLGALRHLDLELVGIDQILGGDTEAPGSNLLDRRAQAVARLQLVVALDTCLADHVGNHLAALQDLETRRVLAPLTGIRLAPQTIHGNCQGAVRFGGD